MGRTSKIKDKVKTLSDERLYTNMSVDDRILLLANLIVQRVNDDYMNGNRLFREISGFGDGTTATN